MLLHKFLADDLNLPEYVKRLKERGEDRFFPEIKPDRDGFGGPVSRRFNEHKKKCGIKPGERMKDFHSFRATFISQLEISVHYKMLKQCVGHSRGKDTATDYLEKYTVKQIYEGVISKLEYPGLYLSHLKNSKYVAS